MEEVELVRVALAPDYVTARERLPIEGRTERPGKDHRE